jgi:histidine ammonia-lyase
VLAAEYLSACQAVEFIDKNGLSPAAHAAYSLLREHIPALYEDRPLSQDLEHARWLIISGELEKAVTQKVGNLE